MRPGMVLLCFMLALPLTGCNSSPPPSKTGGTPTVGVLLYSGSDLYIADVFAHIGKALEGKARLIMYDASGDQKTQDDQMDTLLEKNVAALLVNQVDPQNASITLDKAKKAGVPVVFFNREPDLKILQSAPGNAFVGTNTEEAGILQGNIIAELWGAHPEYDRNRNGVLEFLLFQGNADNPEAIARSEFSVRQARAQGLNMQQLGETLICNWNGEQAREAMEQVWLTHADKIELVLANNDEMALGAISAMAAHGYNKGDATRFIPVVGVDAVAPAVEAIGKGFMSATVRQDAQAMGKAAAAMTLNAATGLPLLQNTGLAWDASGVAVRIPYSPYSGKE